MLASWLALLPSAAWADQSEVVCPRPGYCLAPNLVKGAPAPFTGDLLTPKLSTEWGLIVDGCDKRVESAVARTSSTAAVNRDFDRRAHAVDLLAKDREIALWKAMRPVWYEHPAFVATISVLGTLLVVFAAGLALRIPSELLD